MHPTDPGGTHPALLGLFPDSVVTSFGDPREPAALWEAEAAAVAHAVPSRQIEFANTRSCARRALERLGLPRATIPVGEQREPLWPAGFVGSLTHTQGFCAAAVARRRDLRSLGLDAELDAPLPPDLLPLVCAPGELDRCAALVPADPLVVARILFSIKEAVYKLLFPLTRRFLDFDEVRVTLDAPGFVAHLTIGAAPFGAGQVFPGRWRRAAGLVTAGTWLEAR